MSSGDESDSFESPPSKQVKTIISGQQPARKLLPKSGGSVLLDKLKKLSTQSSTSPETSRPSSFSYQNRDMTAELRAMHEENLAVLKEISSTLSNILLVSLETLEVLKQASVEGKKI
ncbi:uncharacterized protein LOC122498307 [Leptopilina heterotoma]|uniref:uncharacterized protein LOC122498213 n=1 Tax=Leptopilina heterotoma TaxID=63436 RepID=UPI001CA81DD6|nr:uncharacterized protein LOC122498213 [Leptopilina heterotoma]XP_043461924.1 uncharacterized protein LOC122498307 [Leptopilina heterotoma]